MTSAAALESLTVTVLLHSIGAGLHLSCAPCSKQARLLKPTLQPPGQVSRCATLLVQSQLA